MNLHPVIELNNRAVAFMKQNKFQEAVLSTNNALELSRALGWNDSKDAHGIEKNNLIDQCMMQSDVDEHPLNTAAEDFTYMQGVVLHADVNDPAVISIVIIFNAALVRQLLARHQQGLEAHHTLQKAIRLYHIVYLQERSGNNILLKFATMNNLAVIYKALGDSTNSKMLFDALLSTMMLFVDSQCSTYLRHLLGFFANVSPESETAPAA